ncbi:hypothetical protein ABPG75_010106 [Micractinium tetrahymenae]
MWAAGDLESGASTPYKGGSSAASAAAPAAAAPAVTVTAAAGLPETGSWPLAGHYWEDAVYEGQPITDKLRQGLSYRGLRLPLVGGAGQAPLLLAAQTTAAQTTAAGPSAGWRGGTARCCPRSMPAPRRRRRCAGPSA